MTKSMNSVSHIPCANISHNCAEFDLWHKRLGHPSLENMRRLQKDDMVEGIDTSFSPCKNDHSFCDACLKGKQAKTSYKSSPGVTERRLQLIHMDVVGELPVHGLDGERYLLTLLDDYSGFCEVRALSSKTLVVPAIREILLLWETGTQEKVQSIRTDRGTEFINADLQDFCHTKGILHQTSAPYTPQQNGKAERLNRSAKEKLRMLLFDAEAPEYMWVDAFIYSSSFTQSSCCC